MKIENKMILLLVIFSLLFVTACSTTINEDDKTQTTVESSQPTSTVTVTTSSTPEPTTSVPTLEKVVLSNSSDSIGNHHFSSSHYGLHIVYTGKYITFVNYMTMLQHGNDSTMEPTIFNDFEYQAEGLQYYNGLLYFMLYDFEVGEYYLYTYDFENEPIKLMDSTVYSYLFVNGKLYFTKEFVQGPIYSYDLASKEETSLTNFRAHDFTTDGNDLYFFATDAGTAPGLVKYSLSTDEESTVIFPFYSHIYLVHGGYVYYVQENSYDSSVHRLSLNDGTIVDIAVELSGYSFTLNISDNLLYLQSENYIKTFSLDGTNETLIYESSEYLSKGIYIIGDRIYFTDGYDIYMIKKDGSSLVYFPLN